MGQGKAETDILEDGVIRYASTLRGAESGVLADYDPYLVAALYVARNIRSLGCDAPFRLQAGL